MRGAPAGTIAFGGGEGPVTNDSATLFAGTAALEEVLAWEGGRAFLRTNTATMTIALRSTIGTKRRLRASALASYRFRAARIRRSDCRASATPIACGASPGMRRASQPINVRPAVRVVSGICGSRISRVMSPINRARSPSLGTFGSVQKDPSRVECDA
jgi:hypothetical protein